MYIVIAMHGTIPAMSFGPYLTRVEGQAARDELVRDYRPTNPELKFHLMHTSYQGGIQFRKCA